MNYFDDEAKNWDDDPIRKDRADVAAKEIRQRINLSQTMTALEYGCGTGLLSFSLGDYLGHITLADTSQGMLDVLTQKIESRQSSNMKPLMLDLLKNPLPQERFNLIYTLLTLHHIPDTEGILKAFYAVLEEKGYFCVIDLDKEDGSFHDYDFGGHYGFDRHELTEKLLKTGFINIRFSTCYELKKEQNGKTRIYPLFLMIAEKP